MAATLGQVFLKFHGIRRLKEQHPPTIFDWLCLQESGWRIYKHWQINRLSAFRLIALHYVSEVSGLEDLRQKVKVKERIKNKTKQNRKVQFTFKLVDACKSPIYKITCSLPRNPFAYLLHVYCFLQIFPGKGKDWSEGLAALPAPLCFSRAPFKGVNIRLISYSHDPPCSTACSAPLWCQKLCHPSQWLCWFGQHKLRIAQPQVCHFSVDLCAVLWGDVAMSLEMKSPQCWARGENLHILFQISWTSQESVVFECCLSWMKGSGILGVQVACLCILFNASFLMHV